MVDGKNLYIEEIFLNPMPCRLVVVIRRQGFKVIAMGGSELIGVVMVEGAVFFGCETKQVIPHDAGLTPGAHVVESIISIGCGLVA